MARGDVRDDENRGGKDRADEYWKPSAVLLSLQDALVPKFEGPPLRTWARRFLRAELV